jgi:2,4-dienoyl-CoA reductase (NADPH2)
MELQVMGSEGYLINQFIAAHTNHRADEWGGTYENRIRLPIEIVKAIRQKVTLQASCAYWGTKP